MTGPGHLTGPWAEDQALAHLSGRGLRLLERNFRCPRGEIDLVMADGRQLVFVEVRYRRGSGFGDGAESVDRRKQGRLLTAARYYLQDRNGPESACRFDVVAITGPRHAPEIQWIPSAFEMSY